ncbi:MAG: hypothetical protein IPO63_02345 [Bacteroidetes bacterium]|nr:hypothetical protein [Bacteroidota bacterium]
MKLIKLFNTYDSLQGLISLSKEAAKTDDPTLHFFKQNARNNFFDLEAAFRIFRKTHSKDVAEPLYDIYKSAEDAIGKYDFISSSSSKILSNTKLPEELKEKIIHQEKKARIELKQFIHRENWLPDATENVSKQGEQMEDILATESEDFRKDFIKFLSKTISKIDEEYRKGELDPHLLEEGIHEIRRNIRWISIYAKISGGFIQTQKSEKTNIEYKKYLSKDITSSPFIKLPPCPAGVEPISLRFENFAALSWMIQALGELKDEGLNYENQVRLLGEEKSSKSKEHESKKTPETLARITEESLKICDEFFIKDNILNRLVEDINQNKN